MDPRRIVLAVTGGIAAYKIPELVRALTNAGHACRCVLTPEATRFVSPLVLATLSQHPANHGVARRTDSAGHWWRTPANPPTLRHGIPGV